MEVDETLLLPPAALRSEVLAVGEATHGSAEFFDTRAAIVRQMVVKHGTRLVALEASAAATVTLDRVLADGQSEKQVVDALGRLGYWTWHVQEMLDLLSWIAAWNAQHPVSDRVRVVGVDPNVAGSALTRLRTATSGDRDVAAALGRLDPVAERDGRLLVKTRDLKKAVEATTALHSALSTQPHNGGTAAESSRQDDDVLGACLLDCQMLLAGLEQEVDMRRRGLQADVREGLRDERMAALLRLHRAWCAPDAGPVLLLAHNIHIAREVPASSRFRPLGAFLAEGLGDRYYALAQLFGRGQFLAKSVIAPSLQRRPRRRQVTLLPGLPTVEHVLDQLDGASFLLDLREPAASVPETLSQHTFCRAFGAQVVPVLYRTSASHVDAGRAFDGIVYHRDVAASTLLPRPR